LRRGGFGQHILGSHTVNLGLKADVCCSFDLEIATLLAFEITGKGTFDIARQRIMALDQVAVTKCS
jgi:hypothetical protein